MDSPKLLVNIETVRENIRRMIEKAKTNNVELRPHFKTHQSRDIGKMFREAGISGITVSSLKMARYFAEDDWNDITIAFPVNINAAETINTLAKNISLKSLTVDSESIIQLDRKLTAELGLYIELDPDYGRSGIDMYDISTIKAVKINIEESRWCNFEGFYIHAGHTYSCRSAEEIKGTVSPVLKQLDMLKEMFKAEICFGDTPSCSVLDDFKSITQISPGNFVFYDWMQVNIGSCKPEQLALMMRCPVVAKYPSRNEILIHGGAVHFSKDFITDENGNEVFGIASMKLKDRYKPLAGNYIRSLSQEHGILSCTDEFMNNIKVGDEILIIPVHSCLTADLMGEYHTEDGRALDHMNLKKYR